MIPGLAVLLVHATALRLASHAPVTLAAAFSQPRRCFLRRTTRTAIVAGMVRKETDRTPSSADTAAFPSILLETDRYLVIDKPPNLSHHSSFRSPTSDGLENPTHPARVGDEGEVGDDDEEGEEGVLAGLRRHQADGRLNYAGRLYGVHRLDRVTSGILVLAKDGETARTLTTAFRQGTAVKYYTGLSHGKPTAKKQGWVKGGMERGRRKSWYLTRGTGQDRLPNYAVTRFFTAGLGSLQAYRAPSNPEGLDLSDESDVLLLPSPRTLLLFRPYTGRTHQLRVAAKSVGLPLSGDPLYRDTGTLPFASGGRSVGVAPVASWKNGGDRTYLHATGLHIPLPSLNHNLTVFSPPRFEDWWTDGTGRQLFRQQVMRLFEKHCDEPAILNLAERDYREKPSRRIDT